MESAVVTLRDTASAITSRPVQRALINLTLLTLGALSLLATAAIASALFFQNFVPHQVTSLPVYLQYGTGLNPYGTTSLAHLKPQQDYDITVSVSMPRSPANTDRGNFMLSLYLLDGPTPDHAANKFALDRLGFEGNVLFASRRPALVPYVDPVVSLARRVAFLLWHMLFPHSSTLDMRVSLAERVAFAGAPESAYLEVEAGQDIQIYAVQLILTAQLCGLRWLMFHYRLPTYIAFTTMFWVCEVLFMGGAWAIWSSLTPGTDGKAMGKGEVEDEDDAQSLDAYGREPLKLESEVKEEDEIRALREIPPAGTEADDEEDEEDTRDSGLGTSYSESGVASVRRRISLQRLQTKGKKSADY